MINTWANKYITIRFNDKVSEEILVSHKQNHTLKIIIKSFTIFEQKHMDFLYELKEMKI